MTIPFYGGCACGAIRYECTAEPLHMFCCHCRDCQQASGGPYSPAVLVPSKAFKLTRGSPRYYTTPSVSGGTHTRGFCADCGSRLLGAVDPASSFRQLEISLHIDRQGCHASRTASQKSLVSSVREIHHLSHQRLRTHLRGLSDNLLVIKYLSCLVV